MVCPLFMSLESAACAIAARVVGYPAFSEIILEQKLSPRAVAAMLRMSVVQWLNGPRRHRAGCKHCTMDECGEAERSLALEALHDDAAFKRAASRAAKIVAQHWQEIATDA